MDKVDSQVFATSIKDTMVQRDFNAIKTDRGAISVVPHRPHPVRETDEWLWESAREFCAAMDRYAERAMGTKRVNRRPSAAPMPAAPPYKGIPSAFARDSSAFERVDFLNPRQAMTRA
jgi:uncharacterized protein (DUF1684 family)